LPDKLSVCFVFVSYSVTHYYSAMFLPTLLIVCSSSLTCLASRVKPSMELALERPVHEHEANRRLGDAGYRTTEVWNRYQAEEQADQEDIDLQNRQEWERQHPSLDPPQGKPWMAKDGKTVTWFPPTVGGGEGSYYLVQVRVCENGGVLGGLAKIATFGLVDMCGQWWDMYQTPMLSCDISQFELDPKSDHQIQVRTCRDDALQSESIEECKKAWFREWSLISNKFRPAAPAPAKKKGTHSGGITGASPGSGLSRASQADGTRQGLEPIGIQGKVPTASAS